MTNKKHFHIGFHFTINPLGKELQPIFNKYAEDWIKYNENCWIIYTKYSHKDLLKSFKPYLTKDDTILILEIKEDQQISGLLPEWMWTWLHKH